MRSNCLIFAVLLYRRRRRKGREACLMIRRSRMAIKAPHLLYAERRPSGTWRIVSYKPLHPEQRKCPPVLFRGHGRWGDR